MKHLSLWAAIAAVAAMSVWIGSSLGAGEAPSAGPATSDKTVYLRNLSPRYMSDAEIVNDIPAWTAATNEDFAPIWHSSHFRFVFLGRRQAPKGSIVATFVKSGPVKGALAYHTVDRGVPAIVVYTGTGAYYGYNNSVSFTHEIEELAADPTACVTNQGWPYDFINVISPSGNWLRLGQAEGTVWAQEVSDPVEAYNYPRKGQDGKPVQISDFITPNWFNDQVKGGFDFMEVTQAPFTVMPGGYGQFWDGFVWSQVFNFRTGHASDAGFYKGEKQERP